MPKAKPKQKPPYAIHRKSATKSSPKTAAATQPALPRMPTNGAQPDIGFEKDLWEAAVQLRGNIAPADYKHFVLPLLFLRYLSLKYERRHGALERALNDPQSEYYTSDPAVAKEILNDPDEYKREGVFIVPEKARWTYLVKHAQDDDIAIKLDDAMELLERKYR